MRVTPAAAVGGHQDYRSGGLRHNIAGRKTNDTKMTSKAKSKVASIATALSARRQPEKCFFAKQTQFGPVYLGFAGSALLKPVTLTLRIRYVS
jgi:hypothetical protein